jgi:Leucine-rich repeat (LRR) protein
VDISLGALNLTSFPLPLLELPALRTLTLSDNRITSVPHDISRLSTLHALFLNMNPLSELPSGAVLNATIF